MRRWCRRMCAKRISPAPWTSAAAPDGVLDYATRYGPSYREVARGQQRNDWDAAVLARVAAERRADLPADQLAARARWRDNRLMALAAHKRDQARDES